MEKLTPFAYPPPVNFERAPPQGAQQKIIATVKDVLAAVLQTINPHHIDSSIKKYMNYADKSQKLSPEVAEKHNKYLKMKNSFDSLDEQEKAEYYRLEEELKIVKENRSEERAQRNKMRFPQRDLPALKSNYQSILKCLDKKFNENERKELDLLCTHRKILLEHAEAKSAHPQLAFEDIKKRLKGLESASSENVVHNGDTATFSIPGGCKGHYVTYQFKKQGDEYYFIIHNRGLGLSDKAIHGPLFFQHQGMPYAKTSVSIKTTKEALENPTFLKSLLKSEQSSSMDKAYGVLKAHLLSPSSGGIIVKTEEELKLEQAVAAGKELTLEDKQKLLKDPSFHSCQIYGTCSESNLTGPEKELAGEITRKKVKFLTIQNLVNEIKVKRFFDFNHRQYQNKIVSHSAKRLEDLSSQIKNS